jgi:D-tyrosyl-tRNA(Tyr) deacylase
MKAVIQRVSRAEVSVDGEVIGRIGRGLLVLLGVERDDSEQDAEFLARKIANLRIFDDEAGKMNYSLLEIDGEILAISQFTLLGDTRKGRRPSWHAAAPPERANELYEHYVAACRRLGVRTACGQFQARMRVELVNEGPVTLWVDSRISRRGHPKDGAA